MLQQGVINMNDFSFSNRILTLSCHKVFHLPCLSKKNIYVKNIFLMWFLKFGNSPHVPLYLRRRQLALNNVVNFSLTTVNGQKRMRSRHVTQSSGVVVWKSSIRNVSERLRNQNTFQEKTPMNSKYRTKNPATANPKKYRSCCLYKLGYPVT